MPYIYRWEAPDGQGPYNSQFAPSRYVIPNDSTHRPGPRLDCGDDIFSSVLYNTSYRARFGFATLAQARAWFGKPIQRSLTDLGFTLKRFYVPKVLAKCPHQVVFDVTRALEVPRVTRKRISPTAYIPYLSESKGDSPIESGKSETSGAPAPSLSPSLTNLTYNQE